MTKITQGGDEGAKNTRIAVSKTRDPRVIPWSRTGSFTTFVKDSIHPGSDQGRAANQSNSATTDSSVAGAAMRLVE